MTISLKPLGARVVVEPLEQEEVTAGGIVLPETAKEKPQKGKVLSVGAGDRDDKGNRIAMDVKVGDTVLLFGPRAREKGLALVSDIESEVPRGVKGDPTRLRQVLNNLVSNAIKFTQAGEVGIELKLLGQPAGDSLALGFVVRDTGIGIPADKLEAIFEPFVQADGSTTRKFGGTGLGLAICRRIVRLMGGEIHAENPGAGSRFVFDVHLARDELMALSAAST